MYYNLFDSHTHSENSPDGDHSVTFMAEAAINKGLQGFSITDHCEGDLFHEWSFDKRIMQSAVSTAVAKIAFGNRIIMTFGIEVAQVFHNQAAIEDLLSRHSSIDFVIGSLHKLAYENLDYYEIDYSQVSEQKLHEYNLKYFEELTDLVKWGRFDVLGHLSYPLRYPKVQAGINIDFSRYKEQVDEVLKLAVTAGKGIEINTSGLRDELNDTLPPMWVLKRFRELGGEVVTIGSDAHKAENLGDGIEYGMQMLADAGYEYFAFFRGRKPVMLRII